MVTANLKRATAHPGFNLSPHRHPDRCLTTAEDKASVGYLSYRQPIKLQSHRHGSGDRLLRRLTDPLPLRPLTLSRVETHEITLKGHWRIPELAFNLQINERGVRNRCLSFVRLTWMPVLGTLRQIVLLVRTVEAPRCGVDVLYRLIIMQCLKTIRYHFRVTFCLCRFRQFPEMVFRLPINQYPSPEPRF